MRLVSERLVTLVGQRGFRVAPLSAYDVEDTMATRLVIEGEALTRSIERGDMAWGNLNRGGFPRIVATSYSRERTGPIDRAVGAASSGVSHGVALGLWLALAHGVGRPAVRSSGASSHSALEVRVAEPTQARHPPGAQADFRGDDCS